MRVDKYDLRWRRTCVFFKPMLKVLLVVHDTAKTSVAAIAVSGVSVGVPVRLVDRVVRMHVIGRFFR
ncbi:MAG: hypothetical protein MRY81_13000 [Donghicola eburneus]|nr:hypothetical protein [Donghicola eburneus]MCI5040589.1 hypothetical protein [Donghicola eburneus]